MEHKLSLEDQLVSTLETYQGIHRDFYAAKERAQYLGGWLFRLSGELGMLRYKIGQQTRDEQLEAFDKDVYYED